MQQVNFRNLYSRLSLLSLAVMLTFSFSTYAQEDSANEAEQTTAATPAADGVGDAVAGKALFNANCAACHKLDKKATGPLLRGVAQKYDRDWLYQWINDSQALIASGDALAVELFAANNNSVMTSFPGLSTADIDNILAYTSEPKPEPPVAIAGAAGAGAGDGVSNNLILGGLILIFGLLVVMLFLVTNTLKKIATANGVEYDVKEKRLPLHKVFLQNQFLVMVSAIFLLLAGAYFGYGYLSQVGVDQGYAPIQPIHFSHKIHAGDNQIDCNYCHSSARKSKTSGIPSLNVCMNCHKNISEYNGEEDLAMGYTKEFYDGEIAKLYDAAGWDATNQVYTGETEPVEWSRIHNLPDFAYFNHSQHVTVAGVACQKCHGPVEEMEILEQHAPLTMGWCISCHRETNVNVAGNEYYKEIHEQLAKEYGVEQVTAAQMGGLECGKCHY